MTNHTTPAEGVPTYRHMILGERPIDLPEALRLLRNVTAGFRECIEQLNEYDAEHPELWNTCSEHPDENCGSRDLPGFYITACLSWSDVRDAEAMLAAANSAAVS